MIQLEKIGLEILFWGPRIWVSSWIQYMITAETFRLAENSLLYVFPSHRIDGSYPGWTQLWVKDWWVSSGRDMCYSSQLCYNLSQSSDTRHTSFLTGKQWGWSAADIASLLIHLSSKKGWRYKPFLLNMSALNRIDSFNRLWPVMKLFINWYVLVNFQVIRLGLPLCFTWIITVRVPTMY